jgi:hypothetical protein
MKDLYTKVRQEAINDAQSELRKDRNVWPPVNERRGLHAPSFSDQRKDRDVLEK